MRSINLTKSELNWFNNNLDNFEESKLSKYINYKSTDSYYFEYNSNAIISNKFESLPFFLTKNTVFIKSLTVRGSEIEHLDLTNFTIDVLIIECNSLKSINLGNNCTELKLINCKNLNTISGGKHASIMYLIIFQDNLDLNVNLSFNINTIILNGINNINKINTNGFLESLHLVNYYGYNLDFLENIKIREISIYHSEHQYLQKLDFRKTNISTINILNKDLPLDILNTIKLKCLRLKTYNEVLLFSLLNNDYIPNYEYINKSNKTVELINSFILKKLKMEIDSSKEDLNKKLVNFIISNNLSSYLQFSTENMLPHIPKYIKKLYDLS